MNFLSACQTSARRLGYDWSTMPSNIQTLVKEYVNQFRQQDLAMTEMPCYRRKWRLQGIGPYSTGTVACTAGAATVTGTSTVWTASMVGRYLQFDGIQMWYLITAVASTTSLTIRPALLGTANVAAGTTYVIRQLDYKLPPDLLVLKQAWTEDTERQLKIVTDLEYRTGDPYYADSEGSPSMFIITKELSQDSWYSAGTVTVTAAATAVVGTTTTWRSDMQDKFIRLGTENYLISSFTDTTHIAILSGLRGAALSGAVYAIEPSGSPIARFHPTPDDSMDIWLSYQYSPLSYYNDADILDEPIHVQWIILDAAQLMMMRALGFPQAEIQRIEDRINAAIVRAASMPPGYRGPVKLQRHGGDGGRSNRAPNYPEDIPYP